MSDDRLDDAIDAVVRAVDRIERATRRAGVDELHPDARPPQAVVSPGREAWEAGGKKKGKKRRERELAAEAQRAAAADASAAEGDEGAEDEVALPVASPAAGLPALPSSAPAEVHELVGRIVARTQEIDDHLDAVQQLRTELNELVARLGAAATHQR